jgi:hypothetical protein
MKMSFRQARPLGWMTFCGVLLGLLSGSSAWANKAPTAAREAVAQTDQKVLLEKAAAKKKKKKVVRKNGWFPKLGIGVNVLFNHSLSVPGVDDGLTFSLGLVLNGELLMIHDHHEWKTTLKGVHTQTKTPNIEPLVKTADNVDLRSFYTYRFKGPARIGLFAGLQLNLSLLPGFLVTAADTQLVLIDGTNRERKIAVKNDPFALTPAISPLIFKQKMGVETMPYKDKFATLEIRVNAAAQEVWASGFVVQDDATTTDLELVRLRDYQQFGVELETKVHGNINKRISYQFEAELMYPIITSIDTDLQGFDLLNADLSLKVSLKLAKWASLDYVFSAKLIPLLSRNWQVTNNLVLSLKADFL